MHGVGRGLASSFAAVACRGRGLSVPGCALRGVLPCKAAGPWLARRHARHRAPAVLTSAARSWQSELEDLAAERAAAPSRLPAAKGFTAKPAARRKLLAIQLYPSPCLRAANAAVTSFDAALGALARDMFDLMYRTDGVGLAAPQVGVNLRLMVYNAEGRPDAGEEVVLCNPVLEEVSQKEDYFEEGCLSFPEIYADVKRPMAVTVSYQDVTGAAKKMRLDGFQARIFQHEFDHLQGVLFHDRMGPEVLASIQPQLDALEKQWGEQQQRAKRR